MAPLGVRGRNANIQISDSLYPISLANLNCDGLLVSSPYGYSPLGDLIRELVQNEPHSFNLLEENCREFNNSEDFIITGFELNNRKKIILAPNQNSIYYQINSPVGNDIWLDFLYASTYYSLVLASTMNIRRLGLTHTLQGIDRRFIYCIGDAIGLYSDSYNGNTIEEIIFTGCCFNQNDETSLNQLFHLNHEGAITQHREIQHEYCDYFGMQCININLEV